MSEPFDRLAGLLEGVAVQLTVLGDDVTALSGVVAANATDMREQITDMGNELKTHISSTMIAHAGLEHAELRALVAALTARVAALESKGHA